VPDSPEPEKEEIDGVEAQADASQAAPVVVEAAAAPEGGQVEGAEAGQEGPEGEASNQANGETIVEEEGEGQEKALEAVEGENALEDSVEDGVKEMDGNGDVDLSGNVEESLEGNAEETRFAEQSVEEQKDDNEDVIIPEPVAGSEEVPDEISETQD